MTDLISAFLVGLLAGIAVLAILEYRYGFLPTRKTD
jgi:hypothetical protein